MQTSIALSGIQILGLEHNTCNLGDKVLFTSPVYAHNIWNYDAHHIIQRLIDAELDFNCIGPSSEKFACINVKQQSIHIEEEGDNEEEMDTDNIIPGLWFSFLNSI